MRILHVLTLVTPDGAYGGPATVAVNQCTELLARGQDVRLIAGSAGFEGPGPTALGSVPATLFPVLRIPRTTGFAGLMAPAMLRWIVRHGRSYDVAHLHFSRDPIMLLAAQILLWLKVPLVLQTHGMVVPSRRGTLRAIDLLATRRILSRAERVLALTADEHRSVIALARTADVSTLSNGVPTTVYPPADGRSSEVLFLARLHARKRPLVFVEAAGALLDVLPDVRFTLVGPDGGEGPAVRRAIDEVGRPDRLAWEGAVPPERSCSRLSGAAVYVLPSVDEPLGMSVLEAMTQGVPVVITDTCGLADAVRTAGAGLVVAADAASVTAAIRFLVSEPTERQRMGDNARHLVTEHFSMEAIVDELGRVYPDRRRAA